MVFVLAAQQAKYSEKFSNEQLMLFWTADEVIIDDDEISYFRSLPESERLQIIKLNIVLRFLESKVVSNLNASDDFIKVITTDNSRQCLTLTNLIAHDRMLQEQQKIEIEHEKAYDKFLNTYDSDYKKLCDPDVFLNKYFPRPVSDKLLSIYLTETVVFPTMFKIVDEIIQIKHKQLKSFIAVVNRVANDEDLHYRYMTKIIIFSKYHPDIEYVKQGVMNLANDIAANIVDDSWSRKLDIYIAGREKSFNGYTSARHTNIFEATSYDYLSHHYFEEAFEENADD